MAAARRSVRTEFDAGCHVHGMDAAGVVSQRRERAKLLRRRAGRLRAIDAAVLGNCDGLDGTVDGLIQNPAQCSFDPATLVPSVLSAPQAAGRIEFVRE